MQNHNIPCTGFRKTGSERRKTDDFTGNTAAKPHPNPSPQGEGQEAITVETA